MKEGYTITNEPICISDNAILVSNFINENEILNFPFELEDINEMKTRSDIGVWKIKQLKSK